ncbi:hypothetical protein C8R43DRAFT_959555 [Mycena crocata]|nr:hypothetical protein C8R43DRAFT_959555 [Mycena crocata]
MVDMSDTDVPEPQSTTSQLHSRQLKSKASEYQSGFDTRMSDLMARLAMRDQSGGELRVDWPKRETCDQAQAKMNRAENKSAGANSSRPGRQQDKVLQQHQNHQSGEGPSKTNQPARLLNLPEAVACNFKSSVCTTNKINPVGFI